MDVLLWQFGVPDFQPQTGHEIRGEPWRKLALSPSGQKVLPRQPQVDETNERKFALGGGQAGKYLLTTLCR